MTELLCHTDSYLRENTTKIRQVTEKGVVLDETAMYPGGGGQPADHGKLKADAGERA